MQKFEVMYFPLSGCSGSLHKIVVESTIHTRPARLSWLCLTFREATFWQSIFITDENALKCDFEQGKSDFSAE